MRNDRRWPRPIWTSPTEGAVLPFVVLLSLALLALGHAILVGAEGAYTTARAHAAIVETEAASWGALVDARGSGWQGWMDSVPVGGRVGAAPGVRGGIATEVEWRRLSPEAWLLAATSGRPGRPTSIRRLLVWIYDPLRRIDALPGVVSTGPAAVVEALGTLSGDTVAFGVVDAPTLGLLHLDLLLARADAIGPRGRPASAERLGACDVTDPWNWGSPADPAGACGSHVPLKGRRGGLEIEGGEGQVVLIVDGDVLVRAGAVMEGVILASGHVTVTEGAMVTGRVVAFDGLRVEAGSSVVGSKATAVAVLEAVRGAASVVLPLHAARRLGPE